MDFAGLFIASPSADGSPVFKSSTASSFCIASTGILAAFFGRLELSFVVIRRAQCGPPYIKGLRCALFQMSSISGFVKCAAPIQWGRLWKSRLGERSQAAHRHPAVWQAIPHHIQAHCSRCHHQHNVFNVFACERGNDLLPPGFAHPNLGSFLPHGKATLLGQAAVQVSGKVFSVAASIGDEYTGRAGVHSKGSMVGA